MVLAGKLDQASAQAKEGRVVLDFDDLLLKTRNLLAQNPEVRARLKQRFRVVLVDEFQDTNRLQADILAYLLEPDGQTALLQPDESALDTLERAPRRLIVFGDPKQSIYRFRGAEVSVFQGLKDSLTNPDRKGAGRVISLKENFRSQKKLIDFYNAFFPEVMPKGPGFAAEYGPGDSQVHRRRNIGAGPGAGILEYEPGRNEAETREIEAQALALYIKRLLAGLGNVLVTDQARRPEAGDLAVLLRRFTHLRVYEQAFRQAGLPFYTVRGKGFYQCPEVWDLISLLFFLADPNRLPALLGVLRSPLMGLSGETLTRLVRPDGNRVDLADYFRSQPPPWPSGLPDDQLSALNKAQEVLFRLSKEAGRAFSVELIETAVEKTDYLAVLLAQSQGDRKAANVQRFIEITRQIPAQALYAPGETARFLEARLADSQDDPEAQTTLEGAKAIRIMTIHQAKGLEFPVVFVPDAGHRPNPRHKAMLFGADDRFDLTFRDPEMGEMRTPIDYKLFKDENLEQERAENARLLYVAATRAQDHLIFSGEIKTKNDKLSWLAWLTEFAGQRPDLIHIISADEMAEEEPEPGPEPQKGLIDPPRPGCKAREILSRVLERELPRPRNLSLNVTGLSQYLTCPRWFYLEQVLGLPGRPEAELVSEQSLGLDQRQKGIVFHHLLETMDLGSPLDMNSLIDAAGQKALAEGWPAQAGQAEELSRLAWQFTKSPWGRELARSRDGWVKRELPLWLKINPAKPDRAGLTITGVIDLVYVTPEGLARIVDYKYTAKAEAG
ncbi:MAG: 3'-5' exonuclease, partial [Thermodesulfobacteriota bacterium]|nr:3'-5' exonuclease [Thermodesulfobacteriota bacterium]